MTKVERVDKRRKENINLTRGGTIHKWIYVLNEESPKFWKRLRSQTTYRSFEEYDLNWSYITKYTYYSKTQHQIYYQLMDFFRFIFTCG